ncbi:MtN3 and saliva related transmembrane protein [Leeuwenhoekiella aestuarii]|uniref:MtN3 and saliva related transmembrane protein n=2 Tax=Leeuwenhoekiella TaxID=283735 RepID=A0A4Q0NSS2_9FLAO|nr:MULTISPECIES: SemiSWEET transporter [Leeuwenhoekiella]RXG13285.1 MtN3 and saliva related transmembrane protein [Leeuwenhoekiella aestuarii]RXG14984.1 MtN3 and saliva related transmembrane protein [Leeuwenhoekiella aestuarii]RXG26065.1 MtN3 and saliva related transmembrane protein [Leeuwenhoekiella polynyae]
METAIGVIASIFTTLAVLPQVFKVIQTRSAEDISLWMFICLLIGVGSWTIYGIFKEDWPIIITNGLSFLFNSIMVYTKLAYSKPPPK